MVAHPRTKASAGAIRPLNAPEAVEVAAGDDGFPRTVVLRGRRLEVASIEDCWRIDEEWWRGRPITRLYFEALLTDGRRVTVYHDLVDGSWRRQSA